MKRFQILGHDNCALSMLLETLVCRHGSELSIDIYSNIPECQNRYRDVLYRLDGVEIREHDGESWRREPDAEILIAAMSPATRRKIFDWFAGKGDLTIADIVNAIHPTAAVAQQARLSSGIHLSPQVTVAPYAVIGNGAWINRNASVGHHTHLADWVNLNPGVTMGGFCQIGAGVTVGIGATVTDRVTIGARTFVGAGALVTRDLPAGVVAYGVPAKVVRPIAPLP